MTTTQDLISTNLFDVTGFVAVVTGGGTGIGLMATQGLVANGARVYIVGRRKEALDQVVKQYSPKDGPGQIIAIQADITSEKDVEMLAKEIENRESGGINILINNAGITKEKEQKEKTSSVDSTSVDSVRTFLLGNGRQSWHETLDSNLTSQHFLTAALLPSLDKGRHLIKGHSSSVINISSISGVNKAHSSGQFAYAASKAAFSQLTRSLAYTLYPLRIRVNAIEPGVFPSEMTAGTSGEDQKSRLEGVGGNFPAGRTGQESDIASVVLYLASRAGTFVNGESIKVDGGALLQAPSMG